MDADNEIRQLILKSGSTDQIREAARKGGMRTLAEDGWRLVRLGITTVEEVLSVTTAKEVASPVKMQAVGGGNADHQIPNSKSQIPNPKSQIPIKSQTQTANDAE